MIVNLFEDAPGIVSKVSVHVSEYSEANGGSDKGTLYAVEVLFPDGKSAYIGFYKDLAEAWRIAGREAVARRADLLPHSLWKDRQVTVGA